MSADLRPDSGGPVIASLANKQSDFRLLRYFAIAGMAAFLAVAIMLYVLERRENEYFRQVQQSQRDFVAQLQDSFVRQQDEAARRDLLIVHEAGHVNLTRLLANAIWSTHVAPLGAKADRYSNERCRSVGSGDDKSVSECLATVGKSITALPEFAALDAKVVTTIKSTTVFKIKVFDRRGVTIYSSEHGQVGEDKHDNQGWRTAAGGSPASELTHRDSFSAFEGVVEDRDLISSYVPVRAGDNEQVVGVFEIYSDVTPFLQQIKAASAQSRARQATIQARLDAIAAENQAAVTAASQLLITVVGMLLLVLYGVLLLIVRHGQRILDEQARAQAQFIKREEQWHHEKMSALAAMASSVAHEIGNPLAVISAVADAPGQSVDADTSALIREQVSRIAAKTRQIADFAATHSETQELVDVNQMIKAVCEFLTFDRGFRDTRINFEPAADLPATSIIPDHMTEVIMNLLQALAGHGDPAKPGTSRIQVESSARANAVVVRVTCAAFPASQLLAEWSHDPRMAATRRRIRDMGGTLQAAGAALELVLPAQT